MTWAIIIISIIITIFCVFFFSLLFVYEARNICFFYFTPLLRSFFSFLLLIATRNKKKTKTFYFFSFRWCMKQKGLLLWIVSLLWLIIFVVVRVSVSVWVVFSHNLCLISLRFVLYVCRLLFFPSFVLPTQNWRHKKEKNKIKKKEA